jgi:hypothetical protein
VTVSAWAAVVADSRRLDHVVSVRFTPEQMDQLRARIGDGSLSAHIRDVVLSDSIPLDETALHSLPPTRSDERQHVLEGVCWCGPLVLTVQGVTTVRHYKAA